MITTGSVLREQIVVAKGLAPGIASSLVIATTATFIAMTRGGPSILYALLIGMVFSFVAEDDRFASGIDFTSRTILRIGVALLGARITLEQVFAVGGFTMAAVAGAVALTIGFGLLLAVLLGLPRRFGVLSAGATAICGASAAIAISSVLPRYPNLERDTAFTIIGVTTLSTAAMVIYPAFAYMLGFSDSEVGILVGATIHDVAQVVGAGYSVSPEAGDTAIIIKLFRVALLLPVVLSISLLARRYAAIGKGSPQSLLPWFLIAFVALGAANSIGLVSTEVRGLMADLSSWCIITAIAALGMKTSLARLSNVGSQAICLIMAETLFIAVIVLALVLSMR